MSQPQSFPLEVTRALLDCARNARFHFGTDTALVAVQHMLLQTVDLFKTVGDMGLKPRNIFALGKVYSNSWLVIRSLRDMGVTVVDTTVPGPGEFHQCFERDVKRLWQVARAALAQRQVRRILVLDDAGVCIISVPPDVLSRYALCGVEQTSQGIFLFEEEPPPFAVMSWARAAVKLEIGGPIFSRCFIDKMNTEFLRGREVRGKQLGIIGLGSIGRGVASLAIRQRDRVMFYDPNPALQIPKSVGERVTRADSLEELMMRCDYVVGCSGRNPFKGKWPLNYRPGIKLLSASGGDQEFGPIIRDLINRRDLKVAHDTWDITSERGPLGPIQIAYRGYPYNFVSRGAEAVPSHIVQIETGGLLTGLVQARIFLELCEAGHQQNRGIHQVSLEAQQFVYERWQRAMKNRSISLTEHFAYDPDTLAAAQHDSWFREKTEPAPNLRYEPVKAVEERMIRFISRSYAVKAQGEV